MLNIKFPFYSARFEALFSKAVVRVNWLKTLAGLPRAELHLNELKGRSYKKQIS